MLLLLFIIMVFMIFCGLSCNVLVWGWILV